MDIGAHKSGRVFDCARMDSTDRMIEEPAPVQGAEINFDYSQAPGRSAEDPK